MMARSFTLLELLLVVVIVGIIASFAIPGYLGARQRAEGRHAVLQLSFIRDAEKVRHLEEDAFVACAGFAACNTALGLDLANDGWTYTVVCVGGCANNFVATAVRAIGAGWCVYNIDRNMPDPNWSAACMFRP